MPGKSLRKVAPNRVGGRAVRFLRDFERSRGGFSRRASSELAVAETVLRLQGRERGAECIVRWLVGPEQCIQFSNSVRVGVSHVALTVLVFQKLDCGRLQQGAHVLKQPLALGQLGSQFVADQAWILLLKSLAVNCVTQLTQ